MIDPTRVRLKPTSMDTIRDAIKDHGEMVGVETVWGEVLGYPLAEHDGSLNPWSFAIPDDQWRVICGWCLDSPVSIDGMRCGTWINVGPSSYEEEG